MMLDQMSEFRIEKVRAEAVVTMSNGQVVRGCFFVFGAGASHDGPERVGELLNDTYDFVPFERLDSDGPRQVVCNRSHLVVVKLRYPEASLEPGYDVATRRIVTLLVSSGQRIIGEIRIFRPERRARVSDWARCGKRFCYVEADEGTLLVNLDHVVEVSEVEAE